MFGEDFLGFRELGIASEFGVSSLSVPKKLLRPKGARMGAGSSLPYVQLLVVFYQFTCSSVFALQEQAYGTSATLPSAPCICPTRVNTDGRRNYRTLATILQVSFRRSCTITGGSAEIPTFHHSWCSDDRRLFDIANYANHPRTIVTTTHSFFNTPTTDGPTAYTASITSATCTSRRSPNPCSNKNGTARPDRWWEIDERRHEEETKEGERPYTPRNWWWGWRPWCYKWIGGRRNERSYQHECWEWWRRPADDRGGISSRECWRDYRCDADIDYDPDGNTWADWYHGRGTDHSEEERWTRERKERQDGTSGGRHRCSVKRSLSFPRVVFPWHFSVSILPHCRCNQCSPIYTRYHYVLLLISYDR